MLTIKASDVWQTTELDRLIAAEFFGWRWLAFTGRPTREHPEYRTENADKILVRQFFPPRKTMHKNWDRWFAENPTQPATGEEPLSYCYCSSHGPHMVPHFSGHDHEFRAVIEELEQRRKFDEYLKHLGNIVGSDKPNKIFRAKPEERCIAALAAIGSKYVTIGEPE